MWLLARMHFMLYLVYDLVNTVTAFIVSFLPPSRSSAQQGEGHSQVHIHGAFHAWGGGEILAGLPLRPLHILHQANSSMLCFCHVTCN